MFRISQDRTLAPRLWLGALAFWLAVSAIAAVSLWHLRQSAIAAQERELRLLSLALTNEIDRGLRGAEEGFQALRVELRDGRLSLTGAGSERALGTRAELMPLVKKLWLTDRDGRLLAGSEAQSPPDPRSFVPSLDQLAKDAVTVSRPFIGVGSGESMVAVAVRFEATHIASGGWIVAAVPATELLGAFSAASPGPDARMAVFRDDGVLLAGSIIDLPLPDESTVAHRLGSLPAMEIRKLRDGSERMISLHSLPRYALKIVLTRDMDKALGPWRNAVQVSAAGIALLLAVIAASVVLVLRAEQRQTDAQNALLVQQSRASKLESLGRLAGGVAHDFNNVLAAILGFGEMAQDASPPGSDQSRHLEKVLKAALRGKALTERILTFSRGGAHDSIVFELEPVVEEVLTMLSGSLRPGIILERRLEAHGARLRGDPTQAFEATMNLCSNAMQAMSAGGMLSVQLKRITIETARVLSHSQLNTGSYLSLSVSDQGKGIDPAVMEHLFEPFFTTRGAESGTGLGLAVVHGVVADFGGAIDVQSRVGEGSRFTVYFPECIDVLGSADVLPVASPIGAGQALMVVDDEPGLVALAEEMLKGLGYVPTGFSNPESALAVLRENPSRFAALITDEVMPGIRGTELTEAVHEIAPDLPVLLISGYGGALLASRAAAAGVTRVMAKPLQRAELAQVLFGLLH